MPTPQKIPAAVMAVPDHGGGTYSVELQPQARMPAFKPGQFLHLALDDYDPSRHWPDSRVFSIASAPGGDVVRLTYSAVGVFTRRMERELVPGRRVWLKMPYGEFVIRPAQEIVLIAGGTGITPFVAYLAHWAATPADGSRVRLLYGARTSPLLIYRPVAEECRRQRNEFRAVLKTESDSAPGLAVGRLAVTDVAAVVDDAVAAMYYLSGPPAMLAAFRHELHSTLGVAEQNIHIDAWS